MFYYSDIYFLILVIPAMIIAGIAQANISSTFKRYSRVFSSHAVTGAEVARRILDKNGLYNIRIERVAGNLTDHYDPRDGVIRLSEGVYSSTSVAAIGVAAHETGHAIQHSQNYAPLGIRNAIIPVSQIGSSLSVPLIIIGFLMSARPLVLFGIILFCTVVVFQLITLPVEFNASRRAIAVLQNDGILNAEELDGSKKVLTAAALTYVAALLVSLANLLRFILVFNGRNRD